MEITRSIMMTERESLDALKRASFRVFIETTRENGQEISWFGTGFFITKKGFALTAYHNLPRRLIDAGHGTVTVYYREVPNPLELNWFRDLSSEEIDIAVLKLPEPASLNIDCLVPAYVSEDLPRETRREKFRALRRKRISRTSGSIREPDWPLCVFGFPVRGSLKRGKIVPSLADHAVRGEVAWEVFGEVHYDDSKQPGKAVDCLYIDGDKCDTLGGISGGAVLDRNTGWVVAVEGGCYAQANRVYASELAPLLSIWRRNGPSELFDALRRLDVNLDGRNDDGPVSDGGRSVPDEDIEKSRESIREILRRLDTMTTEHEGRPQPVLDYLGTMLKCEWPHDRKTFVELLTIFLSTYNEATLPRLVEAHLKMARQVRTAVASLINEIIDLATPLQIPPELWDPIQKYVKENHAVLSNAAAGLITAEAAASRAAGTRWDVRLGKDGKLILPLHQGEHSLEGAIGSPQRRYASFVENLFDSTNVSKVSTDLSGMLEHLNDHFAGFEAVHHRPPYIILKLPEDKNTREAWLRDLAQFKKDVPHVMFIELCSERPARALEARLGAIVKCLNPALA
jgi:hypothetical protein